MNQAIERRWIGYDWFKLIVALILAALLLLFRPAISTETTAVTPTTSPPAAATAPSSVQINAPILTSPAPGAQAAPGPMTFSGTGTPGTKIELVLDGASAGTATVGADGKWSLPITLSQGEHDIVARSLGATGQIAAAANPAHVTVSGAAQAPTAEAGSATVARPPAITAPAPGATVAGGSLTLSGSGTPGNQVEILDGTTTIGTAAVDADGMWRFPTTATAGKHAYAVRPAGDTTATSPQISITVTEPTAPAGAQPLAITAPADGASFGSGPITLAGTGAPGSQVEILDSDKVVGKATVGADGSWSFQATPGGNTAAYSARPAGATDVTSKPIRVTIGAASAGTCRDLAVNCDAWVTRSGGLVLRLRAGAGTSQSILARLPVGTQMTLLEGPQAASGLNWWRVRTLGGREGWVAGQELRTQPD